MGIDTTDVKRIIEENYDIQVENIEKVKNVYKIGCKKDFYCLKVIKYEFSHFLFILEAIKHLQQNDFESIPEVIKTAQTKEYIEIPETGWYAYLTKWVDSRECNYDDPLDILVATSKLADLHNKSKGFIVTNSMKPRIGWYKWIENFNNRKTDLENFKNLIQIKEKKTHFDSLFFNAIKDEVDRSESSIENLRRSNYLIQMEKEIVEGGFCHHDYANHNVLMSQCGKINIIDFDYCILDSHLHDLSSLLLRKMKNGKWDIGTALFLLNVYSSVFRLQQSDIPIIAAFMEFPQDFWQVGIQYYYEKQPWEEENFLRRLNRCLEDREEKQEFIVEFRTNNYFD